MSQLTLHDKIIAMQPENKEAKGTSLDFAKKFEPGSREVTIAYTRIPGYRSGRARPSWGFAISDDAATTAWYNLYTCARPSARRTYEELKRNAEDRGFKVKLVVDPQTELTEANFHR